MDKQRTVTSPPSTAERLLAAAEYIVLRDGGAHGVSVRRIATRAGENPALISYHFGGLEALLGKLLELNVNAICDRRATQHAAALTVRGRRRRLESLIAAYMETFWTTPAIWHPEAARSVVREVFPMLDARVVGAAVARINSSVEASAEAMAALLPHLSRDELLVRLRLLAGAADTLRVQLSGAGLYPLRALGWERHDEILQQQLLKLSLGALKAR